jgi:hypothetical protein
VPSGTINDHEDLVAQIFIGDLGKELAHRGRVNVVSDQ